MNELVPMDYQILVQEGNFELIGFDKLNRQIDELGVYLGNIEVTHDNVQENKKLVAQVRKVCNNLNDEKIKFKKLYMKPYENLDKQVKALTKKAGEYEELVRKQIREIEEQDRKEKRLQVKEIFDKRRKKYGSDTLYPFEQFLKPSHLNKSVSISSVEKEISKWLHQRKEDLDALEQFSETVASDIADIYDYYSQNNCNLGKTVSHFTTINTTREQLAKEVSERPHVKSNIEKTCLFKINQRDKEKVEQLLTLSDVAFTIL